MSIEYRNPKQYVSDIGKQLRNEIGKEEVLATVSGGVDSAVSSAILKTAGITIRLLTINTGFLRNQELESVVQILAAANLSPVEVLDKQEEFYQAQEGKIIPEDKRIAFRDSYFSTLMEYVWANQITHILQGTQFATGPKKYHNDPTEEFMSSELKLVEPVRGVYKDQVRAIARYLNLPPEISERRAFPGPGLLIRFGGEYTPEKLETIREATQIIDALVAEHDEVFHNCYQIFPYLLDATPVTYVSPEGLSLGDTILIRAVKQKKRKGNIDYVRFPIPGKIAGQIVESLMAIPRIARVCMDYTPKYGVGENLRPGGTIEYQ